MRAALDGPPFFGPIAGMAAVQDSAAPEAPWRNRIVGYGEEAPDQLLANPANYRIHPGAQQDALSGVLADVGLVQNIVVNRATGFVIDGHLRVMLAMREGQPTVPITYVDLSEAEEAEILATLDPIGAMAGADKEKLAGLLAEIQAGDARVVAVLEQIGLQQGAMPQAVAEREINEPPINPVTRPGDLWLLGEHRLLCGDATSAANVATVLAGATPNLMVTDPPYGVGYEPAWRNEAGRALDGMTQRIESGKVVAPLGARAVGVVPNDDRVDWREAWALFGGNVAYVWHAGRHASETQISLEATAFEMRSQIVWVKQHFVIGRGHYHWQHEPCWYAVRKGKAAKWKGGHKQSTVWNIQNRSPFGGEQEDADSAHSAQKPIECMRRPILNHTKAGDDVYDPFVGSGTTIIAAEEAGRACQALDIDPAYVDVSVKRWQDYTGQSARLEANGKSFSEMADERYDAAANSKGCYDDAVEAIREKKTGQRKASRSSKPKIDQAAVQ